MDKAGTLGFAGDLPLEEGNALPFVGAAVAGAMVQWNGVADVAKIAKLKTPDGADVFPSSVAVARDIAAFFVARHAAHA